MAFTTTTEERIEALATTDVEERLALIAELDRYLAATQVDISQFAEMIGKGSSTIRHFLANRYHNVARSDQFLRARIRTFLDANPISNGTQPLGRLYETENVKTLRHWFNRCLAAGSRRGRMACVYAGPGSQKTFVTEHLVADLNREQMSMGTARCRAFHIYCSQDERPLSLVSKMLLAAGIARHGTIQKNLTTLRFNLRQNRALFIFDEAQHLSIACLEIIRELNDLKPYFGVMLLGSHKLREFFTQKAAEMEQWHSRITEAIELPGIAKETIAGIVRQELHGLADFDTPQGKAALNALLQESLVRDIYSGKANQHYYSVRKVFMAIDQIREEAGAEGAIQ